MKVLHHYNKDHEPTSAKEIVPYIKELINPLSVIDIGCGLGQWLKVFKDEGITDVVGIDGYHVKLSDLYIDKNEFIPWDISHIDKISIKRRFDLCLCLEVAEHIDSKYSLSLINSLISFSDVIIFSAAIPNQTGENHINEQFPDYWRNIFSKFDYVFLDPFRSKYWKNDKVNWWYCQNMFLVVKIDLINRYPFPYDGNIYIHPKLFNMYVDAVSAKKPNELSYKEILKICYHKLLHKTTK
jgi:SAM-dependent methyltransferase